MKFGCHISIKNGFLGAAKEAFQINASSFQYFPKNPRSLEIKDFNREDAQLCSEFCHEHDIVTIAHTPYPTSLTPTDERQRERVIVSLLNDLEIAEACGSIGVVVHFGKQINEQDPLQSYLLMIQMLNEILTQWDGSCKILLENNAGRPGNIGTTLEELMQVRQLCAESEKIGFCFDTCHAFACGLWNGDNWNEVVNKGQELGYFDHLYAIHLNNCQYDTGEGKDRHANIFEGGYISEKSFTDLVTTPILREVPFILETPKERISHAKELEQLMRKWG